MVLKGVENRLERLFERTLSRPFKGGLQPIEIGQRMVREIDLTRRLTNQGPISPNQVRIWLSNADAERFDGFQKALISELAETVRQHAMAEGYNFVGPVEVEVFIDDDLHRGNVVVQTDFAAGEAQPRLIADDGRTFRLGDTALVVGRSPDVEVVVNDPNVSRRHAEFWRTTDGVAVKDLQSTNGTYVNGHRVNSVTLSPRDDVTVGPIHFRIELA